MIGLFGLDILGKAQTRKDMTLVRGIKISKTGPFECSLCLTAATAFNRDKSRIEMHLQVRKDHTVNIKGSGMEIDFRKHETILTEISRKFTPQGLTELLSTTGFTLDNHFAPENGYYSLVLARPQQDINFVRVHK